MGQTEIKPGHRWIRLHGQFFSRLPTTPLLLVRRDAEAEHGARRAPVQGEILRVHIVTSHKNNTRHQNDTKKQTHGIARAHLGRSAVASENAKINNY